jgi:Zn finger protein HypA/HybF involved in hydrogenase expression
MEEIQMKKIIKVLAKEKTIKLEPLEFYRNIPRKSCIHCGQEYNDQYECYTMVCPQCITKDYQS